MLRASSQFEGREVDVARVTAQGEGSDGGVPHGDLLVAYADAVVVGEEEEIAPVRRRMLDELGVEPLVDATAVVGNFQRMVRIADGTGIPLDGVMLALSDDLRDELSVENFAGSGNTPPSGLGARLLAPILRLVFPRILRRSSRTTRRAVAS